MHACTPKPDSVEPAGHPDSGQAPHLVVQPRGATYMHTEGEILMVIFGGSALI